MKLSDALEDLKINLETVRIRAKWDMERYMVEPAGVTYAVLESVVIKLDQQIVDLGNEIEYLRRAGE